MRLNVPVNNFFSHVGTERPVLLGSKLSCSRTQHGRGSRDKVKSYMTNMFRNFEIFNGGLIRIYSNIRWEFITLVKLAENLKT